MENSTLPFVDDSKIQLKEVLPDTGYTNEYILKKLHENNKKFVDLLGDNKISKISAYDISDGKGYCSRVFKTTLYWGKESESENYTFILKIPTDDAWYKFNVDFTEADKENNKKMLRQVHNTECDAYDLIKDLQNFPRPEIYYLERATLEIPGMIMMNDLSERGASLGIFFSVTEQHILNLAKHVAELQAYVDFLPGKPWKGKFTENIHAKADIEDVWKKMMLPLLDYEDKELAEKIKVLLTLDILKFSKYSTQEKAQEMGCDTLCHGDMWTNNMMIEISADGSISNQILAYIDFQAFFNGNPLFDIARFTSCCADAEIRRDVEYKAVDLYYNLLTQKYKDHGEKMKFTREEAHTLYELALIQETILMALMFGVVGLPLKDSKSGADQAKVKKLALRLHLLFDDADIFMDKHGIKEKFTLP